jgi:hypothetical protein
MSFVGNESGAMDAATEMDVRDDSDGDVADTFSARFSEAQRALVPDESRGEQQLIDAWEAEGEQELVQQQGSMSAAERRRWNAFTQQVIRQLPHEKLVTDVVATHSLLHAAHRRLSRRGVWLERDQEMDPELRWLRVRELWHTMSHMGEESREHRVAMYKLWAVANSASRVAPLPPPSPTLVASIAHHVVTHEPKV